MKKRPQHWRHYLFTKPYPDLYVMEPAPNPYDLVRSILQTPALFPVVVRSMDGSEEIVRCCINCTISFTAWKHIKHLHLEALKG